MDTDDNIFSRILDDVAERCYPSISDEQKAQIDNLISANPSVAEQDKIWKKFTHLREQISDNRQLNALSCFICNEKISPQLQNKALLEFAKEISSKDLEHTIIETNLKSVAAHVYPENIDSVLAIGDNVLNRDNGCYILFDTSEVLSLKGDGRNLRLTECFLSQPEACLKLLRQATLENPLDRRSLAILEQIHKGIKYELNNNPQLKENVVLSFEKGAKSILDIKKQAEIKSIENLYDFHERCLKLPTSRPVRMKREAHSNG